MSCRGLATAIAATMIAASACSSPAVSPSSSPSSAPGSSPAGLASLAAPTATPITPAPSATASLPAGESLTELFDPAIFDPAAGAITNDWLPLRPGTEWVYEGEATIDGIRIPRRVVLVITDLVKTVAGVPAVVGFERDYNSDVLVESELMFWAQDARGTVWRLGEYPEAYEDGQIVETPIWIHGFENANAGIAMKADPEVFGPSYSQGWGPAVGWTDRGRVFEIGSVTCVPFDCYEGVLVVDEFNPDEPDTHQLKYYARGTGLVRVGWAGAREEEQEVLELVSNAVLIGDELAEVRSEALEQDARGAELSPDVYAQLPAIGPG